RLHADLLHGGAQPRRPLQPPRKAGRGRVIAASRKAGSIARSHTFGLLEIGGKQRGYSISCAVRAFSQSETSRGLKMKSGILSAAIVACGFLAAAPASAQGVKIGILNDQSGVYADYGGKWSYEAALLAVEDFGGSVLGQKIEVISADHQNKPDLGAAIARRWYDTEGVDMITELTTSSVALAVHEISKEKKKVDI